MSRLGNILNDITERVTDHGMFAVTQHTTEQITLAANTNTTSTLSITKSGYYPIGIVGVAWSWTEGQTALLNLTQNYLSNVSDGSAAINYSVRNMHTSRTVFTYTFYVLWVKI